MHIFLPVISSAAQAALRNDYSSAPPSREVNEMFLIVSLVFNVIEFRHTCGFMEPRLKKLQRLNVYVNMQRWKQREMCTRSRAQCRLCKEDRHTLPCITPLSLGNHACVVFHWYNIHPRACCCVDIKSWCFHWKGDVRFVSPVSVCLLKTPKLINEGVKQLQDNRSNHVFCHAAVMTELFLIPSL